LYYAVNIINYNNTPFNVLSHPRAVRVNQFWSMPPDDDATVGIEKIGRDKIYIYNNNTIKISLELTQSHIT
jgi:hypothetical protein